MVSCLSSLYVCLLCELCVTSVAAVQVGMSGVNRQTFLMTGLHAREAICELHPQVLVHNCIWL